MSYAFSVCEALIAYITLTMVSRYVFLQRGFESKKQKIYHIVAVIIIVIFRLLFNGDMANALAIILVTINICVAGTDDNAWEKLMIIPIIGISDGLLVPIVVLPSKLLAIGDRIIKEYQLFIFCIFFIGLTCFWLLGKKWRENFERELGQRALKKWEKVLLSLVGALQLIFSILLNLPIENLGITNNIILRVIFLLLGLCSLVMNITMITVILVGNKQDYYSDKISDMQRNIIIMMAEIVENRDENTGGHIRRTAKYVEIISKQLRKNDAYKNILTDEYIKDIMVAAPLHDVGKIHVPDAILNKPGRLDDEEFEIMKTHAPAGRKLLMHAKEHLGDFSYLDMAVQMAGCHHEWWDGSKRGYPDGLAGEDIPLCGRIMAVADVFDALISKRCYKDPMPIDRAFGIIREETGTHFDPDVARAFFEARPKIEEAVNAFNEEEERHCLTVE